MPGPDRLELSPVSWPEIRPGDDLVALLCRTPDLRDGDIVVITSKVVSKAEGRVVTSDRDTAVADETRRVVARRGATVIAETRHGLVLAAAGVDASNTPAGTAVLLPLDPDASARGLREGVYDARGLNVGVVVSDTAGRAWRLGQTDLAVGCAGLEPLEDLAGTRDTLGNELLVTAPAVADELAAAADLVAGKTSGCPVAVARGLSHRLLAPGEHGPGAGALVRAPADDLFGMGTREAVEAAAHRVDRAALDRFVRPSALDPAPFVGLLEGWLDSLPAAYRDTVRASLTHGRCHEDPHAPAWGLLVDVPDDLEPEPMATVLVAVGRLLERADTVAAAHRMDGHEHGPGAADPPAEPGWRTAAARCWRDG